jgi:hypothetical protein
MENLLIVGILGLFVLLVFIWAISCSPEGAASKPPCDEEKADTYIKALDLDKEEKNDSVH